MVDVDSDRMAAAPSSANEQDAGDQGWVGPSKLINRSEYIRLMAEALHKLGFEQLSAELERQSGLPMTSPAVKKLQARVVEGAWAEALALLPELGLRDADAAREVKWLLLRQKLLELLELGNLQGALACLREEVQPLGVAPPRLHRLSRLLFCPDPEALRAEADWPGAGAASRQGTLRELLLLLPIKDVVPEGRLEELVEQAVGAQMDRCLFHNALGRARPPSLMRDYVAGPEQLPSREADVKDGHGDEVWHVQWSNDGRRLATASKNGGAAVWELQMGPEGPRLRLQHMLKGHQGSLTFLAWSPDDKWLITCASDKTARMWNTADGSIVCAMEGHSDAVTAAAWLPGSRSFYTGGLDRKIIQWDLSGNEIGQWRSPRINDLAVCAGGSRLVSICAEKKIRLCTLAEGVEHWIVETDSVVSLAISGRYMLVNLSCQEIHLYDLGPDGLACPSAPAARFRGQTDRQGRFVIRSGFGGGAAGLSFVVSGSEDSNVYIWHREKGTLLASLPGHSGAVNAVSWNSKVPGLLASASDDHTVRLWASEALLGELSTGRGAGV